MSGTQDVAGKLAASVARRSYGRLLAIIAARTRDVAVAEDALGDAFAAALASWPKAGLPDNPEAWILTAARRRAVDGGRRQKTHGSAEGELRRLMEAMAGDSSSDLPDERLALVFACAHPAIDPSIRAPLILQTLLGLEAADIASAFLVRPATMAQRLVRAKSRIRETGIPFRIPDRDELPERLHAVLDAIYAAYGLGWADPAAAFGSRDNLVDESIWLARLIVDLLPEEPEALGLLALMLHAEARRMARRDAAGAYVPLSAQNTELWNATMIAEAEAALRRAAALGRPGRFQIEAAVQSAHATRKFTGQTDWQAIAGLYALLYEMTDSPVVAVNRAAALGEAGAIDESLSLIDKLASDSRLAGYQPYWAARAAILERAGRTAEADEAYGRAIGLESDAAVRSFLIGKRNALSERLTPPS